MTKNDLVKQASLRTPDSAIGARAITPGTPLQTPTRAFYCGTGGNATITMANGSIVTLNGLLAGVVYPLSITNVSASGLTAGSIIALY